MRHPLVLDLVVVSVLCSLSGCANMGRKPVVYAPPIYVQPPVVQYGSPQSEWRPASAPIGEPTLATPQEVWEGPALGHPNKPEEIPAGEPHRVEQLPAPTWRGTEAPEWRPLVPVPPRPNGSANGSASSSARSMPEEIILPLPSVPPVMEVPELAPEVQGPRKEGPGNGLRPTAPMPWFNPKGPRRSNGELDKFA